MKQALREKQKVERRVRFREPGEIITNGMFQAFLVMICHSLFEGFLSSFELFLRCLC